MTAEKELVRKLRDYLIDAANELENAYGTADLVAQSTRAGIAEADAFLSSVERVEPVAWPKLDKRARVGGIRFGVGVSSRLVVESAQRHDESEGEVESRTPEQRAEHERNRRDLYDMMHGSPYSAPQESGGLRPMEFAPKDGTMVRLLVKFPHSALEDNNDAQWSMGFNSMTNSLIDQWDVVGWDWSTDRFVSVTDPELLGWLPIDSALPSPPTDKKVDR